MDRGNGKSRPSTYLITSLLLSPNQAAEVAEQQRLAQQREQDDNCTEIYNNLTSDILTENPDVAISLYGPHRMVPYRWKGMTPEQLKKMWKTQQDQRKEKQASGRG